MFPVWSRSKVGNQRLPRHWCDEWLGFAIVLSLSPRYRPQATCHGVGARAVDLRAGQSNTKRAVIVLEKVGGGWWWLGSMVGHIAIQRMSQIAPWWKLRRQRAACDRHATLHTPPLFTPSPPSSPPRAVPVVSPNSVRAVRVLLQRYVRVTTSACSFVRTMVLVYGCSYGEVVHLFEHVEGTCYAATNRRERAPRSTHGGTHLDRAPP